MTRSFYDDPIQVFRNWADSLKLQGIARIKGNLIGDDNAFEENGLGHGWMMDDLIFRYAAEVGALQFNDNSISVLFKPPDDLSSRMEILPQLNSSCLDFIDLTVVFKDSLTNVSFTRAEDGRNLVISGIVQAGSQVFSRSFSLRDPTEFYLDILKETLLNEGIILEGEILDCDDIDDWNLKTNDRNLLFVYRSPPLLDILRVMMKKSNNLQAETLIKTIGFEIYGNGSLDPGRNVQW